MKSRVKLVLENRYILEILHFVEMMCTIIFHLNIPQYLFTFLLILQEYQKHLMLMGYLCMGKERRWCNIIVFHKYIPIKILIHASCCTDIYSYFHYYYYYSLFLEISVVLTNTYHCNLRYACMNFRGKWTISKAIWYKTKSVNKIFICSGWMVSQSRYKAVISGQFTSFLCKEMIDQTF